MTPIPSFSLLGAIVLLAGSASAATLASYGFSTNLDANTPGAANVTATAFTGTGTARSTNSYAYQFTQSANSGYMEFGLTATAGQLLDLSTITFGYDFLQSAGTAAIVNANIALVYSLDSFATSTPVQSFNDASTTVISTGVATFTSSGSLDLSGVPNTNSIKFRFLLTNTGGLDTSNYRYGIDSVVVDGVVVVPEPSAPLLAAAGVAASLGMRRRRR